MSRLTPVGLDRLSVCIVGMHYRPETTGNAPYTHALARALSEAGAAVHVVTGIPHYPQWRIDDPTYRSGSYWSEHQGEVRLTRCRHWVPAVPNLWGRLRMEAGFMIRAWKAVRADRSDVLICVSPTLSGLAAGLVGRRSRPVGALVQDLTGNAAGESGSTAGNVSRAIAAIEYTLLRRCTKVGVIAPRFATTLERNGVKSAALAHLPNFTHITPVGDSKSQARSLLGWDQNRFTVVHSGNMGRKQGLESVVEAARLAGQTNSEIEFVLMGDGNQRRPLETLANGVSNIRFVDPVDEGSYPRVLAAADVLLLHERQGVREMSLPSKLTSYTAARRPILAAVESGGITHEVLSAAGIAHMVQTGHPAEIMRGVHDLKNDLVLSDRLGERSHQYYLDHFTRESADNRYRRFAVSLSGAAESAAHAAVGKAPTEVAGRDA